MSGISPQILNQEHLNTALENIPYAQFLGVDARYENGMITTRMAYADHLVGDPNMPALHGGTVGALLELTGLLQLLADNKTEHMPRPIDINIDYLRPARTQDTFAQANITKQGRRVTNVRVEAWQKDPEHPICALHGHFLLQP